MIEWLEWLTETRILNNDLRAWLIALFTMILVFLALRFLLGFIVRRVDRVAKGTATQMDDLVVDSLRSTRAFFLVACAAFVGLRALNLSPESALFSRRALFFFALLQVGIWGTRLIRFSLERRFRTPSPDDLSSAATIGLLSLVARACLWVTLVLVALNNFGVNITALVAGLGVGGIAIALAVQNILGDLLASLTIALDKPFIPGDFIVVGDTSGHVERIGLKTTRVRSLSGEQLIYSNTDLLQSRVRNYRRMQERRVAFKIGVIYQTEDTKLRSIPKILKQAIERRVKTRFERASLIALGESSLDYEVVYWVTEADFAVYAELHQEVLLEVLGEFGKAGIEFAYPTRTLFLNSTGVPAGSPGSLSAGAPVRATLT